jgi:hypothetical protein
MCGFCQFLDALGAAGDKIGKGELGGNMDRLHRHCSWPQDLHHLHRWGDGLCLVINAQIWRRAFTSVGNRFHFTCHKYSPLC